MLHWIVETTVVTAVLALVLAAVCRGDRWGPASRHALWLIVLLRFLAPSVGHWPLPLRIESTAATAPAEPLPPRAPAIGPVADDPKVSDDLLALEADILDTADAVEPELGGPVIEAAAGAVAEGAARTGRWPSLWGAGIGVWLAGAIGLTGLTVVRLARVLALVGRAGEAPEWLRHDAERLAETFGLARAPRLTVSSEASSPFLWCLGRPRLVVPAALLEKLSPKQWSGILAHELAHLRRRDHWVSWLVLGASLAWWWNPVFWLVRRRLEADAELACDAWAVGAVPGGRRPFAQALVEVACGSRPAPIAPALGMSGAGRFLERRLIMIARERVPYRPTRAAALAAAVLGLLALPAWIRAQEEPRAERQPGAPRAEGRTEERRKDERPAGERRPDERRVEERRVEERREGSDAERDRRERIEKARAELREQEERLHKAEAEFNEHVRRRRQEFEREVQAASKSLHERAEQVAKAHRELAELEGRAGTERRATEAIRQRLRRPEGLPPVPPLRGRPTLERREVRVVEPRDRSGPEAGRQREREGSDLERRMEQLEHRFDELLRELRTDRGRRPGTEPARRDRGEEK